MVLSNFLFDKLVNFHRSNVWQVGKLTNERTIN